MKALSTLSLLCLTLSFTSCQKKYCWHCTTRIGAADHLMVQKEEDVCNETEDQIRMYEGANTFTTHQDRQDSLQYTMTTCSRN